jgi:hypothetical protein
VCDVRSPKVSQDLGGIRRRIADIVEDLADPPVRARDDRDPVEQAFTAGHERGKPDRAGESELGVAEELKRQVEPAHKLLLVRGALSANSEDLNA